MENQYQLDSSDDAGGQEPCDICQSLSDELQRITDKIREHELAVATRFFQEPSAADAIDIAGLLRQFDSEDRKRRHLLRARDATSSMLAKHQRKRHG